MTTILVASSEPRAGRSLIAAALAYRIGRAGKPVTLARLAGDDGAAADATAFDALEGIVSPGRPLALDALSSLAGDLVLEAPAGSAKDIAAKTGARVIVVGGARSPDTDIAKDSIAAVILTRVAPIEAEGVTSRAGVAAVLREDHILAAPSIADIAKTLNATWLAGEGEPHSIGGIMIGTVASDAASPYFANRERTCVITRFDKTDIQLAALQTDLQCLVITGGREPSPYLIDRVKGSRDDVALLLTSGSTVESMNAIEGLYSTSRFDGETKLLRAVTLLDEARVPLDF